MSAPAPLPVLAIAGDLRAALAAQGQAVLTAPTGSGKSTQVPRLIAESLGAGGAQVLVLEPRRLACRLVARRVAQEMGGRAGERVGYLTRHESKAGPDTQVLFMTPGLLLRRMQEDPALAKVGAVVLDEFHERGLEMDQALGLLRALRAGRRPDLRLVVMSATLDAESVSAYLGAPILRAEGRMFPVEIRHLPRPPAKPAWELAADALDLFLPENKPGDILVFMPGAYEIRKTLEAMAPIARRHHFAVHALHGEMTPEQQDAALAPSAQRKIIVSTNVAETSITIDGLGCVVDSGLARQAAYDAERGINTLGVKPIARASADQRAGRAGRTLPGVALRLWTAADHAARPAQETCEARRLELSGAYLQLLDLGQDPVAFPWFEAPAPAADGAARALLEMLGATADGRLTEAGRRMARFPAHPRAARMLVEAARRRCLPRACLWAALAEGRDLLTRADPGLAKRFLAAHEVQSDLLLRERLLEAARVSRFDPGACSGLGVNASAAREAAQSAEQLLGLCRRMGLPTDDGGDEGDLLKATLAAYGDHVGFKPDGQRPDCLVAGRRKISLAKGSVLVRAGPMLALSMQELGRAGDTRTELSLASAIEVAWLEELFPQRMTTRREVRWNAERNAAEEVEERMYDAGAGPLAVAAKVRPAKADGAEGAAMLVERLCDGTLKPESWDEACDQWLARVRCVAGWFPEKNLLTYGPEELRLLYMEFVGEATRWNEVKAKPVLDTLRSAFSWDELQFIDKMAPARLNLPSGYPMKLRYEPATESRPARVVGDAKIQQLYDCPQTPTVAGGRVKLLLEILGPNYRPVQVTGDLASFWANTYEDLKKDLKRRYPRQEWR